MYKRILLPVDMDQESSWKLALPVALEYCQIFGAALELLTVLPNLGSSMLGSYFPPDFEEKTAEDARQRLEALASKKIPSNVQFRCHVGRGTVYEEILQVARDLKTDLIVMASHRPELKDYLLGPNAARVVRHAPISVLVVRR